MHMDIYMKAHKGPYAIWPKTKFKKSQIQSLNSKKAKLDSHNLF